MTEKHIPEEISDEILEAFYNSAGDITIIRWEQWTGRCEGQQFVISVDEAAGIIDDLHAAIAVAKECEEAK